MRAGLTYKMELGGLWLVNHFKGEFGGAPFEGKELDAYDPLPGPKVGRHSLVSLDTGLAGTR
jgi:hypothetical protein